MRLIRNDLLRGRILIMYRVGVWRSNLFLGELDKNFHAIGEFHKITFPGSTGCEDARFFIHQDQLCFSFVVFFGEGSLKETLLECRYRTGIGLINDDLQCVIATSSRAPTRF